ncbi:hypothetical protein BJV78DRAFT_762970 [Lactifluus subvellereus]|nr:hypothetical protein BJV78DRAFT_762970 [Lactifluus subvellereus]
MTLHAIVVLSIAFLFSIGVLLVVPINIYSCGWPAPRLECVLTYGSQELEACQSSATPLMSPFLFRLSWRYASLGMMTMTMGVAPT